MRVLRCGFALLFAVAWSATFAAANDLSSARATVESFHGKLLQVMREAEPLGFSGRRDTLQPEVGMRFDVPFIAALVTGRYWRDLDDLQRRQMVDTFHDLTAATYASRFDGYAGEEFKVLETKPLTKQRVLVRTVLTTESRGEVSLDYVLHEVDTDWRVVNVIADGVSELSIKRADYSGVLKVEGFDSLITKLRSQIEALEGGSE